MPALPKVLGRSVCARFDIEYERSVANFLSVVPRVHNGHVSVQNGVKPCEVHLAVERRIDIFLTNLRNHFPPAVLVFFCVNHEYPIIFRENVRAVFKCNNKRPVDDDVVFTAITQPCHHHCTEHRIAL